MEDVGDFLALYIGMNAYLFLHNVNLSHTL